MRDDLLNRLTSFFGPALIIKEGNLILNESSSRLRQTLLNLRDKFSFVIFVDLFEITNIPQKQLVYLLMSPQYGLTCHIKVTLDNLTDQKSSSFLLHHTVSDIFLAAAGPERRILHLPPLPQKNPYEYEEEIVLPLSTPAFNWSFSLVAYLQENRIKNLHLDRGYLDFNASELLSNREMPEKWSVIEKMNRVSSLHLRSALTQCYESILGVSISERAQAIRMFFLELDRIFHHVYFIETILSAAKFPFAQELIHEIASRTHLIRNAYSGKKPFLTIGGIIHDLPNGWFSNALSEVQQLTKNIAKLKKIICRDPFLMQMLNFPLISKEQVVQHSVTGILARSIGANYDVRKKMPYYLYSEVDFETPLGTEGLAYDLLLCRVLEMDESLKIIAQILDFLPIGPCMVDVDITSLSSSHKEIYTHFIEAPSHGASFSIAPSGEITFHSVTTQVISALPHILQGKTLEESFLALSCLAIDSGEGS